MSNIIKNRSEILYSLSKQYPHWRLAADERDEFSFWMGDSDDWKTFLATPRKYDELLAWLRKYPTIDSFKEDDWRDRCKRDFRKTSSALLRLGREGNWFADRWRESLQAWSDETVTAKSWRCIASTLSEAPDDLIKDIMHSMSWWIEYVANTFEGQEDIFFRLVRRVLLLHREDPFESDTDPTFKAINHPIGHVTEALLHWWYRQKPQDNQLLPDALRVVFSDICDNKVPIYRHCRLLLAAHVIALFRVDPEWTKRYILPLFDWERSEIEATSAWVGFLWSPRLYSPFMETVKTFFLATAQHYKELHDHGEQYAALITFVGLEPGDIFSAKELAVATRTLPEEGLRAAAETLVRALEGSGEQRAKYWQNRIIPYLKHIWPKDKNVLTEQISESFARLCVAAQDAFPEAVHELKPWLRRHRHPDFVVHLLCDAKLCGRFPFEALTFLDVIAGDGSEWPPGDLKKCLDEIRDADQSIEGDDRFRRLTEYLRQRGDV